MLPLPSFILSDNRKWLILCEVTQQSKTRVCGRSQAGIEGSNRAGLVWMSLSCECCALLGRGLWNEPIPCPGESYRLWCVLVCDLKTSTMRRPWPALGCCAREQWVHKTFIYHINAYFSRFELIQRAWSHMITCNKLFYCISVLRIINSF